MPVGPSLWRRRGNEGGNRSLIVFAGDVEHDDRNSVSDDVGSAGVIALASPAALNRGVGETLNIVAVTFACKRYVFLCVCDCICVQIEL